MRKVFVRKVLEYDPTFSGKYSKYDGYTLIGLQKLDPGILKEKALSIPPRISSPVYFSSLRRAYETALNISRIKRVGFLPLKELNEIKFDLRKLVEKREYDKYGSNLVRERFIEAFIEDKLMEKRISIRRRIENILVRVGRLPDGNYVLISHSFFMKVLEIFLKDGSLFSNPKILRRYFNPTRKTFDYGKGFEFIV